MINKIIMFDTFSIPEEEDIKGIHVVDILGDAGSMSEDCDKEILETSTVKTPECKVSVFDVAAYILEKFNIISTIKLQKLVYYCQAWSLVWDETPLFPERIEAWVNGPVVRDLFAYHRGVFQVSNIPMGVPARLNPTQKETIDAVLGFYGQKTAQQLVDISHLEDPWQNARHGMDRDERGEKEISLESMAEYYTSISVK